MSATPPDDTNPSTNPNIALEIDVQTALALTRATTRAVCAISPAAQRAMVMALHKEARAQEVQSGPVAQLVAALITGHAQDLA